MPVSPSAAGWQVASATTIGSFHVREHLPNQDAAQTWAADDGSAAIAVVADGHGHPMHFRSGTGSQVAATRTLEVLRAALPEVDPQTAAAEVVELWRDDVLAHARAHPMRSDELRRGPLVPYGTTLVAIAVTGTHLVVLQIGDGDAVLVRASGRAHRPVVDDPALDGVHTSSLCQPDPISSLRTAVVALDDGESGNQVTLAYVATDGLGKARVDPATWWRTTGTELESTARAGGIDAVRADLPRRVAEPAQVGGDDTTIAVVART